MVENTATRRLYIHMTQIERRRGGSVIGAGRSAAAILSGQRSDVVRLSARSSASTSAHCYVGRNVSRLTIFLHF